MGDDGGWGGGGVDLGRWRGYKRRSGQYGRRGGETSTSGGEAGYKKVNMEGWGGKISGTKKVDLEVGGGANSEDGRETRDERELWREMKEVSGNGEETRDKAVNMGGERGEISANSGETGYKRYIWRSGRRDFGEWRGNKR